MDNLNIQRKHKAEFRYAERLSTYTSTTQLILVFSSLLLLVLSKDDRPLLFTSQVVLSGLWVYFNYTSSSVKSVAERARRVLLFSDGLGIPLTGKACIDLEKSFNAGNSDLNKETSDKDYFKSNLEPGFPRLIEMIEESCFWSAYLYNKAARFYTFVITILIILAMLSALYMPLLITQDYLKDSHRIMSLVIIWLVTGSVLMKAISFSKSAKKAELLDQRFSEMVANDANQDKTLIYLSDYNSMVESTPIIPNFIYNCYKDELNHLWHKRKTG